MSSRARTKEVGQCSYRVAKQLRQGLPRELIHIPFTHTHVQRERCLVPSCDTMAPEPSLRTTYRHARDHRRRRRPARQQRASGPARKPQQTGACFAHPPTPLERCACRRTRCSPARSKPGWMPVSNMASTLTGQLEGCRDAARLPGRRPPGARWRLALAGGREPVRRPERENGDRAGTQSLCDGPQPSQSVYGRPRRLH